LAETAKISNTIRNSMYCISGIDCDFNMILNDTIIDCFLDESDKKDAKAIAANEFDTFYEQLKDPRNIYQQKGRKAKRDPKRDPKRDVKRTSNS